MKPPGHPVRLLVVEDEAVSREKLAGYLAAEGFNVLTAEDGNTMRKLMRDYAVDLVLLDINLPGESGLTLARELRATSDIGIILVTGRTDEVDRIVGLEIGADDYVTKPYNTRELLVRVRNLLRRTAGMARPAAEASVFRFEGWSFAPERRRLEAPNGELIKLTRAEYELLSALVSRPGVVLSRDHLMDQINHRIWAPNDRSIDVLVGRLRRKLEPDPRSPTIIVTAHGEGYVFTAEVTTGG
ncbi:two-component system response regulator TorR [Azospirillum soli]|uniref:two-component system response regulator TorR n=1 Tax=Azospirillum soli TaxID=1304799 RepID=UPI001AE209CC|nr:two-component system response regulator TorR [Azospirillum soli]MBP2316873.1 two-component system torCAD operon response regulator TorR [Azospirillum soli]